MRFVPVAKIGDVPVGAMRVYEVEGREIVIANRNGDLDAFDNRCPHLGGPLGQGRFENDEVQCPWHGWRWETKSGRARWPSVDWRVTTYPVKLEGDTILVRVE